MKKILLAEDEAVLRMLVVDTLEDEGYEVVEAADGQEALDLFNPGEFDLLILDYMMPIFSGLDVIKKIRSTENGSRVKILMLSAKSQQNEQDRILEAGADYFMSKPFSPIKLIERVEEIIDEA
ncbi:MULTISPECIES: response regulator transcription factor [Lysinibacillus]|uniref:Response regulator n=1 Tax=Lysinibacillus antri TaxID=2498145 RepID=A0A432L939_9BACI|nr:MULTISPECIES: response regulator [Lysinibacillus]RUL49562.1 response regulator [Lysinibacillus antri]TSI02310.1 response regulator [Lysinibacillus sp. BW-2-10]